MLSFAACCQRRIVASGCQTQLWKARCPVCACELRIPERIDTFAGVTALIVALGAVSLFVGWLNWNWMSAALGAPLLWGVAGGLRWAWIAWSGEV